MRILIADDEGIIRLGLRRLLQGLGHTVVAAAPDGGTALRLALEERPDLAILDIKMPVADGLEVARALSRLDPPIPVVLLTAYGDRELVEQARETGTVAAYLVKPVREPALAATLELIQARQAVLAQLRREAADLRQALRDREVVERAKRVLMARGRSEREAFLELRNRARRQGRRLAEVAQAVLEGE